MEEKEVSKLTAVTYCQEIVNHLGLIGQEGGSSKLDALVEMLTEGDLAGEKVIVFTRFRKMVDIAIPVLEKEGVKCTRVTGTENDLQRRDAMNLFQKADSGTNVIFITMAGGDAINLQAAKAIVFYDSPWSAGDLIQILGRMIRIGSDHDKVYAFNMVAESGKVGQKVTIDGRVQQVLAGKMNLIEAVIGKRVKGEKGDAVDYRIDSDVNELFNLLKDDAKGK
jgi:SNF2 family DNA or RNA helicase